MNEPDPREVALDWLVRSNDPEFDRWDEFTSWLEAAPANADAYHGLSRSEAELRPLVEAAVRARSDTQVPRRRRFTVAAALAAFAAAATAIVGPRLSPVDYATAPGEVRIVALGGQDRLVMNGATRIELAGWNRRSIRLAEGQVLLELRDPTKGKVELQSGDLALVDIGTVFEVARDRGETRVVVSEGQVLADPKGARLKLGPGQRLVSEDGAAVLRAVPADTASVGSFARGQLVYVDEPLEHIVSDLNRSTGLDISADPAISAHRFTGTLSVAQVKRDPRSLGPLVGVSIEQSGTAWKLGGRT